VVIWAANGIRAKNSSDLTVPQEVGKKTTMLQYLSTKSSLFEYFFIRCKKKSKLPRFSILFQFDGHYVANCVTFTVEHGFDHSVKFGKEG
jgi:hypothetical protein